MKPHRRLGRPGNAFRHGYFAAVHVQSPLVEEDELFRALLAERPDSPDIRQAAFEVAILTHRIIAVMRDRAELLEEERDWEGWEQYRDQEDKWDARAGFRRLDTYERRFRSRRRNAIRRLDLAVEAANGGWQGSR